MSRPAKTPFFSRIAFKTALLMALMLGTALVFREALLTKSVDLFTSIFGESPDPLADFSAFYPVGDEDEDSPPADEELFDLLHTYVDMSLIGHMIPNALEREEPGGWRIQPEVLEQLEEEYMRQGQGFAWLDPDRHVIASSDNMGLTPGDHVPPGFAYPPTISAYSNTHPAAWSISSPIYRGSERIGWIELVQLHAPGDFSALTEEEAEVMAAIEARERREANFQRAGLAIVGGIFILLLAAAISMLVTRRVTKLAALATSTPETGELPGPFDDSGRDEISSLAGALNTMRTQATSLLERMEQRDSDRRRFIAQVSHDLRTPLTALVACLDGASLQIDKPGIDLDQLRSKLRERIGLAHTDADRVSALADDLLEVARMDMDDPLDLEPVPPGELIRHAIAVIRPLADQRGLELELEVVRGMPTLEADGRRLLRAIENLLRNAVEHANKTICVQTTLADQELHIQVTDDGPGLPMTDAGEVDMEEAKRIRSRADSAGLGLALARRVAEAHGGRLTASNLPAGGAAVGLALPIGSSESAGQTPS